MKAEHKPAAFARPSQWAYPAETYVPKRDNPAQPLRAGAEDAGKVQSVWLGKVCPRVLSPHNPNEL